MARKFLSRNCPYPFLRDSLVNWPVACGSFLDPRNHTSFFAKVTGPLWEWYYLNSKKPEGEVASMVSGNESGKFRNEKKLVLAGVLVLSLLAATVWAQVTASIVGTVRDSSGAVIPGTAVTVKNLETGAVRTVIADEQGYYRALSLSVGLYEVAAGKTGFKTQLRTGINLVVGQEAVVAMNLEVGEVQQAVTVTAEAPIVNTTTASTAGVVGEREIKDLPLNGRSFDDLIALNPGTSKPSLLSNKGSGITSAGTFSVAGRRGTDNLFLLNGIEYSAASIIGTTPGGVGGQLLGIDAVREFNVQANTYGAQYGKRAGGQVSVVTKSGGNQLHGSLFEFMRNETLDARDFFDKKKKPAFRRNNFGGSAGGPIRKDKTFIFGSYEGLRERLTTTNPNFVPDANARRGFLPIGPDGALVDVGLAPGVAPFFALWPELDGTELGLGGGIASVSALGKNPVREDFGTVRVDHVFSEKDQISGSHTIDDSEATFSDQNPRSGTLLTQRMQVASLAETRTFSPSIINTARIGFSRAVFFAGNGPQISLPQSLSLIAGKPFGQMVVGGSVTSGSISASLSRFGGVSQGIPQIRNLFTYSDSLQMVKGKHLINFGATGERLQAYGRTVFNGNGAISFSDLQSFLRGRVGDFRGLAEETSWTHAQQWQGGWYVDDTIQVLPNFTLRLGLRHEFTNAWTVKPRGRGVNWLLGPDGVVQTEMLPGPSVFTENNAKFLFGPRIGLAWDPFGKGKTSIRAGFGTHYNFIDDLNFMSPQPASVALVNLQLPFQLVRAVTQLPPGSQGVNMVAPGDAKTPTVQAWTFSIEQRLTESSALTVNYAGSSGYHFLINAELNAVRPVICSSSLGNCPAGLPNGTQFFPAGARRRNPNLAGANAFWAVGNSKYHSLQIDLRQRYSRGLTFRANYSVSKALDNGSHLTGSFFTNCSNKIQDESRPSADNAPACYDIPQRFSFSSSYELPLGSGMRGAAGKLLGGWRLNGIVSAQSGAPFTPLVPFNNSRNGNSTTTERPSVNPNFSGPVILGTPDKWFNPNAFVLPPAGTFGNLGRNTLRNPGLANVDMSLFKDTGLGEKLNLEFRAEFFNLFNRVNLGPPSVATFTTSGAPTSSAGVITRTLTTSRQIQLGLKLVW